MIACLLMTISRHFASVFPIKSMACVVSPSIWPLKTVSPYIMRSSLPILITVNTVWHFCSNRSLYMLEKVNKKALRVVLNDYVSTYRDLLDKVSKPTLYVARLKAIAIEAYKCYVNENPQYINSMFDSVDKPYNLRGGPWWSNPKLILRLLVWILLHIRLRRCGILYPPIIKRHLLFPILSNIYWNGQDLNANVDDVLYVVHMMFDLHVLWQFTSNRWKHFSLHPMCVLNVSSNFHLYHNHRSFSIQSPNSPRLMLFVCSVCDSK